MSVYSVNRSRHVCCVLVQVSVKDIPSRVDTLNEEQQSFKKSLSHLTTQGDGDVPKLTSAVSALSSQVCTMYCHHSSYIVQVYTGVMAVALSL